VPPCTAAVSCATRAARSENDVDQALEALETATLSWRLGPEAVEFAAPGELTPVDFAVADKDEFALVFAAAVLLVSR
jgi:hypothetical protein